MTQIKNPITVVKSGGGGTVNIVNGIVDSFKANSSTIDANTFVDFIESSLNSSDNVIDSTSNAGNTKVGSALIDSDKVFVVYNLGTTIYAVVCTISGTTITVGTATTIASNTNIVYKTSISGIQQGAVVVAFSNYISSSSSNLYTVVCTISGTTITAGEVTMIAQLSAQASYTQPIISMINNSMAVVVTRNSNTGLRYFFLKVAEKSTVATGELRTISTTNQYAEESISVIDSSNIVIFHGVGSSNTVLRGFVSEVPDFLVSVPDRSTGGSIKGLTKTACSTSSAGEVWALK